MAIDLDAMRAKLKESKDGGSGKRSNKWTAPEGKFNIRVMPTPDGDPFKKMFIHYNVGFGFLCPKRNFGEDCPVCAFATQLYKDSKESNDEDGLNEAKKLFVKDRYFSPIVVRGHEDEGVKVWSYSKTIYEELLDELLDPEGLGDFTDVVKGADIRYVKEKKPNKNFADISVKLSKKSSSLVKELSEERVEELLKEIPNFDEIHDRLSTEDVEKRLEEYLSDGGDGESSSSETTKYNKTEKETSSVDDAFDDLLDKKAS